MASVVSAKSSKSMASVIAQLEKNGSAQKLIPVTSKPFVPNLKPTNVTGATNASAPPKIALKPPGVVADKPSPGVKTTSSFKPIAANETTTATIPAASGVSSFSSKTAPAPPASVKPVTSTLKKVFPPPAESNAQNPPTPSKTPAWKKSQPDADKSQLEVPESNIKADRRSSPSSPAVAGAPAPALKTFGSGGRSTLPRTDSGSASTTGKENSILSQIKKLNESSTSGETDNDNQDDSSPKVMLNVGGVKKFPPVITSGNSKNFPPPPASMSGKLNTTAANGSTNQSAVKVTPSWKSSRTPDKPVLPVREPEEAKEEEEEDDTEYEDPIDPPPPPPTIQPPLNPRANVSNSFNKAAPRPPSQPSNPSLVKSPSTVSGNKENTVVYFVHAATGKRYRKLPLPRLGSAKPPKKLAKPREIELERFREVIADDEETYEDATSEAVVTGTRAPVEGWTNGSVSGGSGTGGANDTNDDQEIYEEI